MIHLWFLLASLNLSCSFALSEPRSASTVTLEKRFSWLHTDEAPIVLRSKEATDAHALSHPPLHLLSYESSILRPRDSGMFEEARIRYVERQQSMPIEMEETSTLKPDEKDRLTLLGLAYASWDAYHPFPYNDTKWYSLDEFDWVIILQLFQCPHANGLRRKSLSAGSPGMTVFGDTCS